MAKDTRERPDDLGLLGRISAETLTDLTYARVHQAILDRTLAPGQRVTEAGIAKLLHVSKTPVREALLKLREIGLVEPDGPRRNRIVNAGADTFDDAFEMVELLEAHMAEQAASVGDAALVERVVSLAGESLESAQLGHVEAFRAVDAEFHATLSRGLGNPRIDKAHSDAFSLILALRVRDLLHVDSLIECANQHLAIANAIASGESKLAGDEARAHVRYVRAMLGPGPVDGGSHADAAEQDLMQ